MSSQAAKRIIHSHQAQAAPMTETEARACVSRINRGMADIRQELLDLYEREGWRALGYTNWRECAIAEFNFKQSRVYQLLDAAIVEENISTIVENDSTVVEKTDPIPERQLRPLTQLETPEEQQEAWQEATEKAESEGRKVTAKDVQAAVDEKKGKPHVAQNSGNNEWYTPEKFIEAARTVMGSIDTDPASCALANETVKASVYYSAEDNGLDKPWRGNVWMNPPYAKDLIPQFSAALVEKYQDGEFQQACVLVNNATETVWGQHMMLRAGAICFLSKRVKFIDTKGDPSGDPLQGQMILYFGKSVEKFAAGFSRFGIVMKRV